MKLLHVTQITEQKKYIVIYIHIYIHCIFILKVLPLGNTVINFHCLSTKHRSYKHRVHLSSSSCCPVVCWLRTQCNSLIQDLVVETGLCVHTIHVV